MGNKGKKTKKVKQTVVVTPAAVEEEWVSESEEKDDGYIQVKSGAADAGDSE